MQVGDRVETLLEVAVVKKGPYTTSGGDGDEINADIVFDGGSKVGREEE